jgi:cobalt-zinc-cadmium efflux system protein
MGHAHTHHSGNSTKAIGFAFFLNLFFAIAEIIGGILTNSLAILSDALHDFGDSLILGMSWIMERNSERAPTAKFSYGFRRMSLLSALLNSLVLIGGSLYIISAAIPRLIDPPQPHAEGMMWFAIAGIVLNGIAALRLRRGASMNARVVAWHLLEDVLGWAAVLIASIVMQFVRAPILDPILSLLIAAYILYYNVAVNLTRTLKLFMQGVPDSVDVEAIRAKVKMLPGVIDAHDIHLWSLDGARHVLSAHIVVESGLEKNALIELKQQVKASLRSEDIEHLTLELEYEDEACTPCLQPTVPHSHNLHH